MTTTAFLQISPDQIVNLAHVQRASVLERTKDGKPCHIRLTYSAAAGQVDADDFIVLARCEHVWALLENMAALFTQPRQAL